MAILNTTPDSFSDGGSYFQNDALVLDDVLRAAEHALTDGASILDIGGESTRPGAAPITVQQELDRVLPVVEAVIREFGAVVSVDTSTPQVMQASAAAGAKLINDVRALSRAGALDAAVSTGLPVCLMHMQGSPETMQANPSYTDPVAEVLDWLLVRARQCLAAGFSQGQILLDPGFGFGKTLVHNQALFRALPQFIASGFPILVGVSRKTMIGEITGRAVDQRAVASAVAAAMAASAGAAIVRVHDVAATRDALRVCAALGSDAEFDWGAHALEIK
ncbi:MAG: dihydropteroate synthase [Bacteroidetes bacterium]|nr:dihydropteroate synthase [Bacteroidota bacterium]